jgi:hypothetical protein
MGPLEALLYGNGYGAIDPTLPDAAARTLAETIERENAVAACMKAQGFDYTPHVPNVADIHVDTTGLDRASREFAEQYGFGIVRHPESTRGEIWSEMTVADDTAAMSQTEREAYQTALYGEVTERPTEPDGSVTERREGGGCMDLDAAGFTVYGEAMDFLAGIGGDAAFGALDGEWSACMREAGYSYTSPDAAQLAFLDEVHTTLDADGVRTEGEGDALAAREVEIAVASWDCKDSLDYDARHRQVQDGLEQAWVDEHAAELDAWRAAVDQQD